MRKLRLVSWQERLLQFCGIALCIALFCQILALPLFALLMLGAIVGVLGATCHGSFVGIGLLVAMALIWILSIIAFFLAVKQIGGISGRRLFAMIAVLALGTAIMTLPFYMSDVCLTW